MMTKDLMRTEDSTDHLDASQFDLDKNMVAVSDKGCPKTKLKLAKDMSAIDLFRKFLHRTQHTNKTSLHEEPAKNTKSSPPRALLPPKSGSNLPRPISFLERGMLPGGFRSETTDDKSQTAQLTIFYGGAVNVFDNVTIEKAKAIMLLAGDSASATPAVTKSPKPDQASTPHQSNLPSICKSQAVDLPIARKRSIQSFLAKRRDRIMQKSPYCTASGKKHIDQQDDERRRDIGDSSATNQTFCPSLFPSRLSFFFTVPTKGHS